MSTYVTHIRTSTQPSIDSPTTLNRAIATWLLQPGNTKTVLAEELGISRQRLTARIRDNRLFTWYEVLEIADLTGVPLTELMG